MLIVSDVHGAVEPLRRVASLDEPLLVLGDLINYIDYRSNEGIVADISGRPLVDEFVRIRTMEGSEAATEFWHGEWAHRDVGLEDRYTEAVKASYREVCGALAGSRTYVTYGNVDRPDMLAEHLPDGVRFVDAEVVEIVAAPNSPITRKPLSKMDSSYTGKILIGAIYRDGMWQVAVGDTHIKSDERVIVVCVSLHLKDVQQLFLA